MRLAVHDRYDHDDRPMIVGRTARVDLERMLSGDGRRRHRGRAGNI
jgi:hypothetical protein